MKGGSVVDGYWTNDRFLRQVTKVVEIAELKYPSQGHSLVFIFNQSSNHSAFAEEALNVKKRLVLVEYDLSLEIPLTTEKCKKVECLSKMTNFKLDKSKSEKPN